MSHPVLDLTGQKFGCLTVIKQAGTTQRVSPRTGKLIAHKALWLVQCVCGKRLVRSSPSLRSKHRPQVKSCGCMHGKTIVAGKGSHGMTKHPAWGSWSAMRSRCENPHDKDWKNYGARGITVCKRWSQSFPAFWQDMGATWAPRLTLGRIDNNKEYSKKNCRWETSMQQANNKRCSVLIPTPKGTMTVAMAARAYKLSPGTVYQRLARGWKGKKLLSPTT